MMESLYEKICWYYSGGMDASVPLLRSNGRVA